MKEKKYFEAEALLNIANEHYKVAKQISLEKDCDIFPIFTLMFYSFELLLKACALQQYRSIKNIPSLSQLIEINEDLNFSKQEKDLLNELGKYFSFRKGVDNTYLLDWQCLRGFCQDLFNFYQNLQHRIPVELSPIFQ